MKFAVVGDPVDHSRSPAIHNAAFASLGVDAHFDSWRVAPDSFDVVVEALRTGELQGVSVTMPHKHNAYAAADELSLEASRTAAVNTLVMQDGGLVGHNTDVAGVRHALAEVEQSDEAPILLLGYGGAAAAALLAVDGRDVFVSGREVPKARALIDRVRVEAEVLPWGEPVQMATVINATPLGMSGEHLPDGVVERAGALVDMTYGPRRSPAVSDALAIGYPVVDGLAMLVGQAAEAFELFTGEHASIFVMDQAARS
ncbi:MAG: shikimate dehydrogenase [Actinomycetota bacterium]